jgi:hypothetical protein
MFLPSAYSDALKRRNRNIVMGLSLRGAVLRRRDPDQSRRVDPAHKGGGGPKKASARKDMVALGAKGRAAFGVG